MAAMGYFQRQNIKLLRKHFFVKLQFKLNSSVQVGQGVDFVFPLSQEEQEQELPHQNLNEGEVLEV